MIKVNKLNKFYNRKKKNEIHVLNDVSLEFPEKGLVVLLGASGSGKTTLLNVIGGLDKVMSGQIEINGKTLSKYRAKKWDAVRNTEVGYIFQNYNLLKELSVYENLSFVLNMIGIYDKQEIETKINYMLTAVGMYKFRKRKASELSGGQQQRVAIARALIKDPRIIIADEPTGNLDSKNTVEIMNIIKQISKDKLVVLVTHEKNIAEFYGERIIEFKDGKIVSDNKNSHDTAHNFDNDDTVYLKDMQNVVNSPKENFNFGVYAENKEDIEKANIRLIVKNNTIYIDVDSDLMKVKLVQDEPSIVIKNEHYKKKTREEFIETSFDLTQISHENSRRVTKSTIPFKKSLKLALNKISSFGKRGKLMLAAFAIIGIVFSIMTGLVFNILNVKVETYTAYHKNDVVVSMEDLLQKPFSLQEFKDAVSETDANATISLYNSSKELQYSNNDTVLSPLYKNSNYSSSISFYPQRYENLNLITSQDIVSGRMPENDSEMIIDKGILDKLIANYGLQAKGIWNTDTLLSLTYDYIIDEFHSAEAKNIASENIVSLKFVGVVNNDSNAVYMTPNMINIFGFASSSYAWSTQRYYPTSFLTENYEGKYNLVAGSLPTGNEYLHNRTSFASLIDDVNVLSGDLQNYSFPYTHEFTDSDNNTKTIVVSGIYESDVFVNITFTSIQNIEEYNFNKYSGQISVNTSDPVKMVSELKELGLSATYWDYQRAVDFRNTAQNALIAGFATIIAALLGITAVGFYFLIRSSLLTRIYEISVFRALGVRKKDIYVSFIIEIILVTAITGVLGYILGSAFMIYMVNQLAFFASIGITMPFVVTPISFLAGLSGLFIINIIFGILPVIMLLIKTPSQILSKYDI